MSRTSISGLLTLLLSLLFETTSICAKSQATNLVIDLQAQHPGTTLERPLYLSGKTVLSILLVNTIPAEPYQISLMLDNAELPAITLNPSQQLGSLFLDFAAGHDEKGEELPELTSGSGEEGTSVPTGSSPLYLLDSSSKLSQYYVANVVEMRPGQRLTVRVAGSIPGEGDSRGVWTIIFDGGTRGSWQISLGFGSPVLFDGHRQYVAQRDSSGKHYRIAERRSEELFELIPAVFFHWTPTESHLSDWSWSLTGGLGLDFDEAVIFLGGAVTFNQNITISVGGVAHQVERLNPRYEVGDAFPIELDTEQLHRTFYRVNPFVGVTFRLSSNIFRDGL